jgi:hypothetical protein
MMEIISKMSPIDDDLFLILKKVLDYLYMVLSQPANLEQQ